LRKDSKKVTKIDKWQHEEFKNNIRFSCWQKFRCDGLAAVTAVLACTLAGN